MFSAPIRVYESNENTMEASMSTSDWMIDGVIVENNAFKLRGATMPSAYDENRSVWNERSPLAATVSPHLNVFATNAGYGGADRCAETVQPTAGGLAPTSRSTLSRSSTPVLDTISIGDTVYAKSSLPHCAQMSVAMVEDMWEASTTDLVPASAASLGVLPAPQRIVRLRWLLTIVNIAISRARLPRGSQSNPDELFLTTFCTEESADVILGHHAVKFVCDGLEPTLLSTRDAWMTTPQGPGAPAARFCKFEYDHQLSVFVPLSASFVRTRKATLPGNVVKAGIGHVNPSNFDRIAAGAGRSETLHATPTAVTGTTFLTPVRKRKGGKSDYSPSASRSTTPLAVEPSPVERSSQVLATRVYSSSFHGVSMHKSSQRWHAQVRYHGKRISLGYYDDELEAAQAYDKVARRLGMDISKLNFTETGERIASRKRSSSAIPDGVVPVPVSTLPSPTLTVDNCALECSETLWSGLDSLVAASCLPSPMLAMHGLSKNPVPTKRAKVADAGQHWNAEAQICSEYFKVGRVQDVAARKAAVSTADSAFKPSILRRTQPPLP